MEHAFLFTAYTDFDLVQKNIDCYRTHADCYIHVDKKSAVPLSFTEWAKAAGNVYVYSRYRVNWGSIRHVEAVLYLLEKALRSKRKYGYFHILSADTILTKPAADVLAFFDKTPDLNYATCGKIPPPGREDEWAVRFWFRYYYFNHLVNRKTAFGEQFHYYLTLLQKKRGVNRRVSYDYSGLFYAHYTRDFVCHALEYVRKHPDYLRNLKTVNIPEEFFFQNIIMDSPFAGRLVRDNKIYLKWDESSKSVHLTMDDLPLIREKNDGCLFARKLGRDSLKLMEVLTR